MTPNFIKHKVRPQDTLCSLASRLKMDEEQLKEFHNTNCGKLDKIWFSNLYGIEYILIPTQYISQQETEANHEKLLPPPNYFLGFHANNYSVSEIFSNVNQSEMRIDYTANLKVANQNNKYIVEIILENFTRNEVVPDDKISSLSLACMKSIYPIGIELSDKGTPYAVFNFESLKERFTEKRSEIEDFYTGEIAEQYLNTFSEKLGNKQYFLKQIQSNFLYQSLLVDLKWFHKKTKWQEEINIYPNTFPLLFSFDKHQFFENAEAVQTKISGTLSERCSLRELLKGIKIENEDTEDDIYAETEAIYLTHPQTKQLQSAQWSVKIWHQEKLFQQYQLHLTQI